MHMMTNELPVLISLMALDFLSSVSTILHALLIFALFHDPCFLPSLHYEKASKAMGPFLVEITFS